MNSCLTFKELVHYLDMTTTDPMIRRLLDFVLEGEENIVHGLLDAGMDPHDFRFHDDGMWHTPGDYVMHLRNELDFHEREASEWRYKYEDMKDERDGLRARSVADLLSEMNTQLRRSEVERENIARAARAVELENKELKDKINVWTILETK